MLRVTIELIPSGDLTKRRTIRVLEIANMTDLSDLSDYKVTATGERSSDRREGVVRGHERRRWGPWKLVDKAIRALNLDLEDGR
jgi:hypothetical protein